MRTHWIHAWRVGTLLVVAVVAAVNVISTAQKVPAPPINPPASMIDPIVQHERRFAAFRDHVQAHGIHGTVGYFGDSSEVDDDYFYAQFVLLPLILDVNPDPYKWAVAYLPALSPESRLPADWRVAEDFGEGVLLLRKSVQ
jgi:hypothetical protein